MSVPQERSQSAERLVVEIETAAGSGQFVVAPRLRAEQVEIGADERFGRALISVRLDEQVTFAEAHGMYHPHRRLLIRTDGQRGVERRVLFDGYPLLQSSRWSRRVGVSRAYEYRLRAEHALSRTAVDPASQIIGRHVRTGRIAEGLEIDPDVWAGRSEVVTGLPCVFNPHGLGNCDPEPLLVSDSKGGTRLIHIFRDDEDPRGVQWTLGRILRYLLYFYVPRTGSVSGEAVLRATDSLAEDGSNGTQCNVSDPLSAELRREPISLTCEATNLPEALLLLAEEASCHFGGSSIEAEGGVRTEISFWAHRGGPRKWLRLAGGGCNVDGTSRYPTGQRAAREIFQDNNVAACRTVADWHGLGSAPMVLGAVKKHEMTVQLVPGWLPLQNLDNVDSADRDAAKAEALLPADVARFGATVGEKLWFRRYHRKGADYKLYSSYSRLWVLNEHGRCESSAYNRNWPFDDYRSFDFSTVCEPAVTTHGAWMRRARRFLPTMRRPGGPASGVWVEISFDGGQAWYLQSSGVEILSHECGIFIECDNPCQITPPGVWPDEQNLWYAIIDQTCRVRVTALIESDERLCHRCVPAGGGGAVVCTGRQIVYRPNQFDYACGEGTTNVLSQLPAAGRDDSKQMALLAERLKQAGTGSEVGVWPVIPWIDDTYEVGDRIVGFWGRGIRFAAGDDEARLPNVLGKTYRLGAGRYETELVLG
jgi:hypothetical protein